MMMIATIYGLPGSVEGPEREYTVHTGRTFSDKTFDENDEHKHGKVVDVVENESCDYHNFQYYNHNLLHHHHHHHHHHHLILLLYSCIYGMCFWGTTSISIPIFGGLCY